ncbi:MAG: hypothetical protein WD009_12880 [Phycisphaeraceae bacterium]
MSVSPYQPPSPEQVEAHLAAHEPRPASPWVVWGPLAALAGVVGASLMIGGSVAIVLPWLGLGGVFGFLVWRVRRLRGVDAELIGAQELAMLRQERRALAVVWRVIPRVQTQPGMYVRAAALLAHTLDELKAYEAALAAYDSLIAKLHEDHPGSVHLRLHRTIAALMAEHLTDADEALRRLDTHAPAAASVAGGVGDRVRAGDGGRGGRGEGAAPGAIYRLAELIQRVRTHHFDDAAAAGDAMLDELRPLGISAGYGHALLALCWRRARAVADAEERARRSALWWRRATTLMPAAALVDRFPELRELAEGGAAGQEVAT